MVVLNVTVQPRIKEQLVKLAEKQEITVSDALRRLLETHPLLQPRKLSA
jgi:Ribbon-helix-helix protein, copG family